MGFGSLFRSLSDPKKRPSNQHRSQAQRPQSTSVRRASGQDATVMYYKAKEVYEAEENRIMRDEMHKRDRNDRECKRQMAMIDQKMRDEKTRLDNMVLYQRTVALTNYRAGKISARDYERARNKQKQSAATQWNSFAKWGEEQQAKAQRVFFARGEEIAQDAGAALRRAKARMKRDQQMLCWKP